MISNSMSNTGVLVSVPGIIRDTMSTSEYEYHIHQGYSYNIRRLPANTNTTFIRDITRQ